MAELPQRLAAMRDRAADRLTEDIAVRRLLWILLVVAGSRCSCWSRGTTGAVRRR